MHSETITQLGAGAIFALFILDKVFAFLKTKNGKTEVIPLWFIQRLDERDERMTKAIERMAIIVERIEEKLSHKL